MCLILFSFAPETATPLVVAANRDEFYARPALAAHYWPDTPGVFAGRDLSAGGTWLGVSRSGRFAALTNFSAGDAARDFPASRGQLVADFLTSQTTSRSYADAVVDGNYAGFNLVLFDGTELIYTNNKGFPDQRLGAGHYGLSNAELQANWPKAVDGAAALAAADPASASMATLLAILGDRTLPPDHRRPNRRKFAARFITGGDYGTRAMTLVKLGQQHIDFFEQQVGPNAGPGSAVFARVARSN